MSIRYIATAYNHSTWVYRNGIKICEDIADCGHLACLRLLWPHGTDPVPDAVDDSGVGRQGTDPAV